MPVRNLGYAAHRLDRPALSHGSVRWRFSFVTVQARSRRSVAGKDIMLDPRAGIRKAGAMPPLMALLKEVVEVGPAAVRRFCLCVLALTERTHDECPLRSGNSLAAAIGRNDVISLS